MAPDRIEAARAQNRRDAASLAAPGRGLPLPCIRAFSPVGPGTAPCGSAARPLRPG
jgi:hypothetical protein